MSAVAEGLGKRPRVRSECEFGPRPCPWVSCRHHLLDVRELGTGRLEAGELVLAAGADEEAVEAFTELAAELVANMPSTCALDLADRNEMEPAEVALAIGVTRQRVNQIERRLVPIVRRRAIARGLR